MTTDETTQRKPRLSGTQIQSLRKLLYMEYKPTELAREIGCHRTTIYDSYIPNGAPHRRDKLGHIWIVGTDFAAWAWTTMVRSKYSLGEGQAFCMHCRKPTRIVEPERAPTKSAILVRGRCAVCRLPVARFESPEGIAGLGE